jgi:hypothetical protein
MTTALPDRDAVQTASSADTTIGKELLASIKMASSVSAGDQSVRQIVQPSATVGYQTLAGQTIRWSTFFVSSPHIVRYLLPLEQLNEEVDWFFNEHMEWEPGVYFADDGTLPDHVPRKVVESFLTRQALLEEHDLQPHQILHSQHAMNRFLVKKRDDEQVQAPPTKSQSHGQCRSWKLFAKKVTDIDAARAQKEEAQKDKRRKREEFCADEAQAVVDDAEAEEAPVEVHATAPGAASLRNLMLKGKSKGGKGGKGGIAATIAVAAPTVQLQSQRPVSQVVSKQADPDAAPAADAAVPASPETKRPLGRMATAASNRSRTPKAKPASESSSAFAAKVAREKDLKLDEKAKWAHMKLNADGLIDQSHVEAAQMGWRGDRTINSAQRSPLWHKDI